jgi:hypothetical protein
MKLSDAEFTFRAIVDRLVVFKDKSAIEKIEKKPLNENSDSILTYCYVDNEAGITFEYLCPFNIEKGAMFVQKDKDVSTKFRFGSLPDCEIQIFENYISGDKYIDKWVEMIRTGYKTSDEIKEFRTWGFIDHLRAKEYPDDILVGFHKEGFGGEGMFVKLLYKENDKIFGKLLNEPHQNFGVHLHDIVEVNIGKNENGEISCFCIC